MQVKQLSEVELKEKSAYFKFEVNTILKCTLEFPDRSIRFQFFPSFCTIRGAIFFLRRNQNRNTDTEMETLVYMKDLLYIFEILF